MGVHGLASYLNKASSLGQYVTLTEKDRAAAASFLCIDGFAFIYHVGMIETLRGGDYIALTKSITAYVTYWRAVGLEPVFVWDGPFDASKIETVLGRSRQSVARCAKYMRASDQVRLTDRKLIEGAQSIPVLTRSACHDQLVLLECQEYYAEAEADSPTAELAQRLNGYMLSNDSDYFIFPANCKGYIPLMSIEYGSARQTRLSKHAVNEPARFHFKVYHFQQIAHYTQIHPIYLPLFAALVGNDHTDIAYLITERKGKRLYPGQMERVDMQRITRAIKLLPIPTQNSPNVYKNALQQVLPILLTKNVKVGPLVTSLLGSIETYLLQPLDEFSPNFPLHPRATDTPLQATCRALYFDSFRRGNLHSTSLQTIKHAQLILKGSLEHPDLASPTIALGRPIRILIYAILQNSVGLMNSHVAEHVRKGTEIVTEMIPVPDLNQARIDSNPLNSNFPILLLPKNQRESFLLSALNWNAPIPTDPATLHMFPLILALRHIQLYADRPFTRDECLAALSAAYMLYEPRCMPSLKQSTLMNVPDPPDKDSIQRTVELLQPLTYLNSLSESLLLDKIFTPAWKLIDGTLFHGLLNLGESLQPFIDILIVPAEHHDALMQMLNLVSA